MVPLTAAAVAALLSCPCRVAVKDSSESTNTEVKALAEAGEEKHDWTDKSYIRPILDAAG